MRIGVDFDNTIVNYDSAFHAAATERGLIPATVQKKKNAVRDFLNNSGRKDDFTRLQGYVYGARMDLARLYNGFREFVVAARASGHDVYIVSHRTKVPLLGPEYDMHKAARAFLCNHALSNDLIIADDKMFFEETKEAKINRVAMLGLDVLIDDLPEILTAPRLLRSCQRILFAPEGDRSELGIRTCHSWIELTSLLCGTANE